MLGLGSGDVDAEWEFARDVHFRKRLVAWVERGGRLIVQGERSDMFGNWPAWFGKKLECSDYRRTTHVCRAEEEGGAHWCVWYSGAEGAVTTEINVKAVMMKDVDAEEVLFGTTSSSVSHSLVPSMAGLALGAGLAATVAFGKVGEGSVGFFGDVNAEKDTCAILAVIAREP